jgi:arylsulfatase
MHKNPGLFNFAFGFPRGNTYFCFMRIARFFLTLAAIPAVLAFNNFSAAAAAKKPNVIFFLSDDLGYGDIGCFGQTKIHTPNIDELAKEGMKFTQHYSGSPVCAPSRCVFMTGKHSGHAFIRSNREIKPEGQLPIPDDALTVAELFNKDGYATGAFGKWGLGFIGSSGDPIKQGFDKFFGYNCQREAHNLYQDHLWDNDTRVPLNNVRLPDKVVLPPNADLNDPATYKPFKGNQYAPDLYAEQALKFIRDNKEHPFFLFFPTIVPHVALQVPDDSLKEYEGKFPETPYDGSRGYLPQRTPRAAYAAMITRMDRELGRMRALLKELNLDDNTIFIFTSDNGPAPRGIGGTDVPFFNSNGPFRGVKEDIYEGGIRVPLIVKWTGKIKPGTTSTHVTGFEDWMPTLMELVGAKNLTPKNIDGISFAPVLFGKEIPERPFLYREFPSRGGQQSIRIGDWKGVRTNLNPNRKQDKNAKPDLHIALYNLKTDIAESKDVSAQHPKIVAHMEKLMREQHVPSEEFPLPALDRLSAR